MQVPRIAVATSIENLFCHIFVTLAGYRRVFFTCQTSEAAKSCTPVQ